MIGDRDHLEFLLSQLGDGVLTLAERQQIDQALRDDAGLAALRRGYEQLDRLLTRFARTELPIASGALLQRIKAALAEQIEFQISQSLDRSLAPAEADVLARTLAAGPEWSQRKNSYERLDRLVDGFASAAPRMDMQRLSDRIKGAVRAEALRERAGRTTRWHTYAGRMAIAAALLLTIATWRNASQSSRPGIGGRYAVAPRRPLLPRKPEISVELAVPGGEGVVAVAFDTLSKPKDTAFADSGPQHSIVSGRSDRVVRTSSRIDRSVLALWR